mmetsp:Transcript_11068/g.7704  ORF Transcript_11068/g.7704 Transcript_11068/m.7704 type:complete len:114 (+) Transcript_11068:1545-1886(+)
MNLIYEATQGELAGIKQEKMFMAAEDKIRDHVRDQIEHIKRPHTKMQEQEHGGIGVTVKTKGKVRKDFKLDERSSTEMKKSVSGKSDNEFDLEFGTDSPTDKEENKSSQDNFE